MANVIAAATPFVVKVILDAVIPLGMAFVRHHAERRSLGVAAGGAQAPQIQAPNIPPQRPAAGGAQAAQIQAPNIPPKRPAVVVKKDDAKLKVEEKDLEALRE